MWYPLSTILDNYHGPPTKQIRLELTIDTMTVMERKLLIRDEPGETYSISPHHWILWFLEDSADIMFVVDLFTEWLYNQNLPWEA